MYHISERTVATNCQKRRQVRDATGAAALTRAPIATLNAVACLSSGKICLPIAAIAGLACALGLGRLRRNPQSRRGALCGGRRYEFTRFPNGLSPYIALTAAGVPGEFLLDYGATRSSLSADAFAVSAGSVRTAAISLPSFEKGDFRARALRPAGAKPGRRQLGVIGTDFLSLLSAQFTGSAVFLGDRPCNSNALARPRARAGLQSRLLLVRPLDDRAPGFPTFRSSICASARFARGRRSTPAMPTRSTRARSTSTRLCTTVSPRAALGWSGSATSASGPARAARTGAVYAVRDRGLSESKTNRRGRSWRPKASR